MRVQKSSLIAVISLAFCGIAFATLVGCVRAPGQIQDNEFLSRPVFVETSVSQALINFQEGFRQCGFEGPGVVFAVHYGEPVCTPVRSDGTAVCDVYLTPIHRSLYVHGRVDFAPSNNMGTNAVLRVLSRGNRVAVLDAWERFLRWSPQPSCPTSE
jgi:hypothetical protein